MKARPGASRLPVIALAPNSTFPQRLQANSSVFTEARRLRKPELQAHTAGVCLPGSCPQDHGRGQGCGFVTPATSWPPEGVMPQHCSPGRLWPGGAKGVSPEASFCGAVLGTETGDFPQPCRNCPIRVGAAVQLGLQELRGRSRGLCLEPLGGLPGGGGTWPSLGRGGGGGCI